MITLNRKMAAVVVAVVLLAFAGGAASYGVSAGLADSVCETVAAAPPGGAEPGAESLNLQQARASVRLMVWHGDLRDAMLGLMADVEELRAVQDSGTGPEALPAMMGTLVRADGHLRDAQRACGLAPVGVLGDAS